MFGAPTCRWLPAKSTIRTRSLLFYAPVPEDLENVDDVIFENGRIVISDHIAKKQIELPVTGFELNRPTPR
jgi:hypothetical protein